MSVTRHDDVIEQLAFESSLKGNNSRLVLPHNHQIMSKCKALLNETRALYLEANIPLSTSGEVRLWIHILVTMSVWFLYLAFLVPLNGYMTLISISAVLVFLTYETCISVIQRDAAYFNIPAGPVVRAKRILDTPTYQKGVDIYHGLVSWDWLIMSRLALIFPNQWDKRLGAAYLLYTDAPDNAFQALSEDEQIRTLCLRVIYECLTSS